MSLPIARPNQPVRADDHNKLRAAIIVLQQLVRRNTPRGSADIGHRASDGGTASFIKKSSAPGSKKPDHPWKLKVSKDDTGYKVKIKPDHTKIYTRFTHDEYKPITGITYIKGNPEDELGWADELTTGENWIYLTAQWTDSTQTLPAEFTVEVEQEQKELYEEEEDTAPDPDEWYQTYSRTLIGIVKITSGSPDVIEIDQRIMARLEAQTVYIGGAASITFT